MEIWVLRKILIHSLLGNFRLYPFQRSLFKNWNDGQPRYEKKKKTTMAKPSANKKTTCKLNFSGSIFGGPPQLHHLQRPPFFWWGHHNMGQHGLQKKMSIPKSKRSILPTYERSSPPRYISFFVCIAKSPPKKKLTFGTESVIKTWL